MLWTDYGLGRMVGTIYCTIALTSCKRPFSHWGEECIVYVRRISTSHFHSPSHVCYVDLEYEGGGIGEYQYWDRKNQTWDDTSCQYAERGSGGSADNNGDDDSYDGRCAKMDCHLEDTHFSVLGFFKHRNYHDWMEQLFKHEVMCGWTEEEYAFMKSARKAWPKGCSDTGSTVVVDGNNDGDDDGSTTSPLYYNIRPRQNGRIAVGLYTDEQCLTEYPANTDMVEDIVGNLFVQNDSHDSGDGTYDFSGDSLTESMDRWDSAFDVRKTLV